MATIPRTFAAVMFAIVVASAPTGAGAQSTLSTATHAIGTCEAALPAYEGTIRKRPLALVNEGMASAFVTCAFPGFEGGTFIGLDIWFTNFGNAAAVVRCTFVTGTAATGVPHAVPPTYTTRIRELPAGASDALFLTQGGASTDAPTSVSCALPPQVGIGDLGYGQEVEPRS